MHGRLTLIKFVLNSIHIYVLSVRILPVGVRKKLHSLMSRFVWGGLKNSRKLYLVDWNVVSLPLVKGGLSISRLEDLILLSL